jgi:hypothetical protein
VYTKQTKPFLNLFLSELTELLTLSLLKNITDFKNTIKIQTLFASSSFSPGGMHSSMARCAAGLNPDLVVAGAAELDFSGFGEGGGDGVWGLGAVKFKAFLAFSAGPPVAN